MSEEATTAPHDEWDVVIVGYGPVGAVLANLLGQAGHRVAVIERTASVHHLPRAAHFDHEVMRVFQSIGLADPIGAATSSIRGMHFLDADGRRLFGFDQPDGPTAQGWANDHMFYQPLLEAALRDGVARHRNVEVLLEHEVTAILDEGDGAITHVVAVGPVRADAPDRTIRSRYVIGCDGARSTTRQHAGLTVTDLGFDESWLVVDTRLTAPVDLPDVCQQICDPARPTTYVPLPDPYRRWEHMLLPGETREEMEAGERVLELLAPWVAPDEVEIVRAVVYTFHAVLAPSWRRGRVLIAGDAAHQMPPFLGQGMCAGIRDAANLAWKLDLVLRGLAGDALLDSYESERSPHVREIIDAAVAFGGLICTTDPDVAAARDQQLRAQPDAFDAAGGTALPSLGPGVLDPTGGDLFIQPHVRGATGVEALLDDALGAGFALLVRGPVRRDRAPRTLSPAFFRLGASVAHVVEGDVMPPSGACLELADPDGHLGRWFDDHEAAAVLLRPDRYVFGTAATRADIPALVDRLLAAVGSAGPT